MKATKFTTTKETATGPVTVSFTPDYPVPSKGDVVNIYGHLIAVEEIKIGIDYDFVDGKYTGSVRVTNELDPRVVFDVKGVGDDYFSVTWRAGEWFAPADRHALLLELEGGAK